MNWYKHSKQERTYEASKPKVLLAMMTGMWDIAPKDLEPLRQIAAQDISWNLEIY